MQRRHARHRPVRIGAAFEQEQRERIVAGDDGIGQRVGAVGPRLVRVDTGRQEHLGHRDVAVAGRVEQWREPLGGRRVGVGAGVEQRPRHRRMHPGHRPHQGRAPGLAGNRIDVRAARQQRVDDGRAARPRRRHQRRQPADAGGVRAGARRQQAFDHRQAGVLGRPIEGGDAVVVRRVHVGAGPDQPVGHVRIVPVGGPQQRRGPVGARRVDVGAGVEQSAHRLRILAGGGIDESEILAGGHSRRQQHPHDDGDGHSLHRPSPSGRIRHAFPVVESIPAKNRGSIAVRLHRRSNAGPRGVHVKFVT